MNKEVDKNVWLCLTTTKTWLAWVIRLVTRQRASHAIFSFWDSHLGRRMVLESTMSGFTVKTMAKWRKENKTATVWAFTSDILALEEGLRWVAKWLDTPYDFKGLFWFLVKRWIKKPSVSPRQWKCSEGHVRMLRKVLAYGALDINPESATPGDLLNYYSGSTEFYEVEDWDESYQ